MNMHEAHAVREALFLSRLPLADAPVLFKMIYEQLSREDKELIFQAADSIHLRVKGIGMEGSLELISKIGMLMVELEQP